MRLSAIVAMSENRAIGREQQIPWHLPADLKHFKAITMGYPIIMGRRTYESIGKPLPGRSNIIVSRDVNFKVPDCVVVHSVGAALDAAAHSKEIFVIGGATLYEALLPRTQRLYLTIVHQVIEGDTYFPELQLSEWREVERIDHEPDEHNSYAYSFLTLDREYV